MIDLDLPVDLWRETGAVLRLEVLSGSMLPVLRVGDVIEAVPVERPRVGDIVVVRNPTHFLVHRLIATWPSYRTRGDALPYFDPPIGRERIVARVRAVWRDGERYRLPGYPWNAAYAIASTMEKNTLPVLRRILPALVRETARRARLAMTRSGVLTDVQEQALTNRADSLDV